MTEVEFSAMSTLLFCNRQYLLNRFTSDIHFLDVDRHERKKQAQYITSEQTLLHMPKNSIGFEHSLIVITLECIDI